MHRLIIKIKNDLNPVSRWLDVSGSIGQGINTLPMNLVFADINCDQDFKLLIGDMGSLNVKPKLKVFKGTSPLNEIILPDIPTGVVSFFTNESVPRNSPVVAVSMCSSVYIYKNMKLFYKFYLPPIEVQSLEVDVWRMLSDGSIYDEETIIQTVEKLNTLPFATLAPQSQHLITLPREKYIQFIKQHSDYPMQKTSVITCITTLNMNSAEKDGVACLVLGTENGDVMILDPQTFTILHQARVDAFKGTPSLMESTGLFDVEYRIIIATRESSICVLKREWLEGKSLFQLSSPAVGLLITPGDNSVVVACLDKTLQCLNKKGKRIWSIDLPGLITTITMVQLAHLGANLIGVAMVGGVVHFYNGKNLVDTINMQDTVSVMKFGQIGQEEHVLSIITVDGALILKILKRTADFNLNSMSSMHKSHSSLLAAQQARPLLVPKKSKLFLEQAMRERQQATEMHEIFQKELCQLRLHVARATVEAMQNSNSSLSTGSTEPLKLSAQVHGLGPVFKIYLSLENLSADSAIVNLSLLLVANHKYFKIATPYILVPMLVGGSPYIFISKVTELFSEEYTYTTNNGEEISETDIEARRILKVILFKDGQSQPLLAASISIPATDPLMIPVDQLMV